MMAGALGLEQQVVAAWFPYISAADGEVESLGWKQSWLLTPTPNIHLFSPTPAR